jgi:hypothetical protein
LRIEGSNGPDTDYTPTDAAFGGAHVLDSGVGNRERSELQDQHKEITTKNTSYEMNKPCSLAGKVSS